MTKRDDEESEDEEEDELDENDPGEDVASTPGPNSDGPEVAGKYISPDVCSLYEVYSYRHAAAILYHSFPAELKELEGALRSFRITQHDIGLPGGNESTIPPKISRMLRPLGWIETRIQGDLLVRRNEFDEIPQAGGRTKKTKRPEGDALAIRNFIDGHKIDYVKNRVAFDLEWNSKDQTFDRDLYAFRAFHDCGLISAGVLVTRSQSLNPVLEFVPRLTKKGEVVRYPNGKMKGEPIPTKTKYGASTTWMGKLLYRLNAGRQGGCPVLVFGITPSLVTDWPNK
jgi:hypothetical protein